MDTVYPSPFLISPAPKWNIWLRVAAASMVQTKADGYDLGEIPQPVQQNRLCAMGCQRHTSENAYNCMKRSQILCHASPKPHLIQRILRRITTASARPVHRSPLATSSSSSAARAVGRDQDD